MFFADCSLRKCYTVSAGIHSILDIFTSFLKIRRRIGEGQGKGNQTGFGGGQGRSVVTSAVSSDVSFCIMLPVVWRIFRFIKSI